MNWQKEFGYDYHKNNDFLFMTIIILSIFGLIVNRPILFLIVGLFSAYLIINYFYDKYIGKHFYIVNDRQTVRLFPGDDANLRIVFQNNLIIPYINGTFEFQLDNNVTSDKHVTKIDKQIQTYEVPLSVISRGKTVLSIPIVANSRGVARLRNIQYQLPHLFNFDKLRLKYQAYFSLEFIVFPKILPVERTKQMFEILPGDEYTNFSPYEDILSPLGTRAYTYSDPFQRINWKATAKTQQLQTNVYEKTIDKSYFFIVNLTDERMKGQNIMSPYLEELLSFVAYLTEQATKEKVAYEVALNARRFGDRSYIHLANGQGNAHYMNTMEMLARIHPHSLGISFTDMLYRLRQHILAANIIVFIGEVPAEANHLLEQWQKQNKRLYHVKRYDDDRAMMKPWVKDVMLDDVEAVNHHV